MGEFNFNLNAFRIASNAREPESKFLSLLHPSQDLGTSVLHHLFYFGCEGYTNPTRLILTHQYDNDDRVLENNGISVRNRATLDKRGRPIATDICVKVKPPQSSSHFLDRAEYECPTNGNINELELDTLFYKYSAKENPELPAIIDFIKECAPKKQFVMPVERNRHVLKIPGSCFGIYKNGQPDFKGVIELNDDRVPYKLDCEKERQYILMDEDRELEFELLTKPCEYDTDSRRFGFVSDIMSKEEKLQLFDFVNQQILTGALPGTVKTNTLSKAERGFQYKEDFLSAMEEHYASFTRQPPSIERLLYLLGPNNCRA